MGGCRPRGSDRPFRNLRGASSSPRLYANSGPSGCILSSKAPIASDTRASRLLLVTTQEWGHNVRTVARLATFDRGHNSRIRDWQLAGNRLRNVGGSVMMFLGWGPRNIITKLPMLRFLLPANWRSGLRDLWFRSNVGTLDAIPTSWRHSCVVAGSDRDSRLLAAIGAFGEGLQPLGPLLTPTDGACPIFFKRRTPGISPNG